MGREIFRQNIACEAGAAADTVCFLLCHFSTHIHREGKGIKKKNSRNIWQAGEGLALLSVEKKPFFPKGEEGEVGWLPHTCPAGMGASTHGWQHASCRLGHQQEPFGEKKKTACFIKSLEDFKPLGWNLKSPL